MSKLKVGDFVEVTDGMSKGHIGQIVYFDKSDPRYTYKIMFISKNRLENSRWCRSSEISLIDIGKYGEVTWDE